MTPHQANKLLKHLHKMYASWAKGNLSPNTHEGSVLLNQLFELGKEIDEEKMYKIFEKEIKN